MDGVRQRRSVHVRRLASLLCQIPKGKVPLSFSPLTFVSHSQASPSRSPSRPRSNLLSLAPLLIFPRRSTAHRLLSNLDCCSFSMATRNMHSHYPKRKSSATAVTSSKGLTAASYKSRDPVYGAFDDIGSGGGTVGAGDAQPAALISSGRKDLNEEYDDVEEILRQFDMNMTYGPCLGVSRLERFERARRFGLNPPLHVKNLLERVGGNPDALWEGRV